MVCLRNLTLFILFGVLILARLPAAWAQSEPEIAIGPVIGSTGPGIAASTSIIPGWLTLNAGVSGFGFNYTANSGTSRVRVSAAEIYQFAEASNVGNIDGLPANIRSELASFIHSHPYSATLELNGSPYHAHVSLGTVPIFLGFYPTHGCWDLQLGAVINNNQITVRQSYSAYGYKLGSLSGSTHFNHVAPFIGVGFGRPLRDGRIIFTANLGVFYEGGPNITLQSSNAEIARLPPVASLIRSNQRQLNKDFSWARFFPVLNFGLVYRF